MVDGCYDSQVAGVDDDDDDDDYAAMLKTRKISSEALSFIAC